MSIWFYHSPYCQHHWPKESFPLTSQYTENCYLFRLHFLIFFFHWSKKQINTTIFKWHVNVEIAILTLHCLLISYLGPGWLLDLLIWFFVPFIRLLLFAWMMLSLGRLPRYLTGKWNQSPKFLQNSGLFTVLLFMFRNVFINVWKSLVWN